MARVEVSSELLNSMLSNRYMNALDVAHIINTRGDFINMCRQNTEVEFDDLCAMAKYFKKPWTYFLQEGRETIPHIGHDNRTVANKQVPISGEMFNTIQDTELLLDSMIDLFPEYTLQPPNINLSTAINPKRGATSVRQFLGVTAEQQLFCKDDYSALNMWSDALRGRGVYVIQRSIKDDTIKAFSITKKKHALALLNTQDTPYARIFSLLHEYCHLILRNSGICDLSHIRQNKLERYCNEFAANVLLPESLIGDLLGKFKLSSSMAENDRWLQNLSHRFRVSQATILIRLASLGQLDDKEYRQLEKRRSSRRGKASPGGDYYTSAISAVGKGFVKNVFDTLTEGKINRTDASVLLGVGEHLIDKLRNRLHNA